MKKVHRETAELAREKGFMEATEWYYEECCETLKRTPQGEEYNAFVWNSLKDTLSVPYQSELQKWLREKYNLLVESTHYTAEYFSFKIYKRTSIIEIIALGGIKELYSTYEEALEEGLKNALQEI